MRQTFFFCPYRPSSKWIQVWRFVSGGATVGHGEGGISSKKYFLPPPKFSPKIMTSVLKLEQIWQFQHKNIKNINFLHALHTFIFHFLLPPKKILMLVPPLKFVKQKIKDFLLDQWTVKKIQLNIFLVAKVVESKIKWDIFLVVTSGFAVLVTGCHKPLPTKHEVPTL